MTTIQFIVLLYWAISGGIFASFAFDEEQSWWNIPACIISFVNGWFFLPFLIGRILKKLYEK